MGAVERTQYCWRNLESRSKRVALDGLESLVSTRIALVGKEGLGFVQESW